MASITKRGNSYLFRVSCGFDGNGKRLMKSQTWTPPANLTPKQAEKEAQRQAVLFEEKCRTGQYIDSNTRFRDFTEIWLKNYAEKQLRATTLSGYKDKLQRINAAFGNMKLKDIQPHHLLACYDNLSECGVRLDMTYTPKPALKEIIKARKLTEQQLGDMAGISNYCVHNAKRGNNLRKHNAEAISAALGMNINELFEQSTEDNGLSDRTILHHHRLISCILHTAVQWQLLLSNPCERVKPSKVRQKEARYLDEIQAAKLLETVQKEPYQFNVAVQLLLYTGMRRGELCGLEWSDFDVFTGCLHIQRSALYLPDKGVFLDEPKNETSKRVIKLSASAVQLLKDYREWQEQRKAELGTAWHTTNKMFTRWDGEPINPNGLSTWFHAFVQREHLADCSLHSLRHTNATLLIASGAPLKTVSKRLGHSNVSTTGNIYTHAIQSADEAAAAALDDILSPTRKNSNVIEFPKAQ